jgi:hypothetical protein
MPGDPPGAEEPAAAGNSGPQRPRARSTRAIPPKPRRAAGHGRRYPIRLQFRVFDQQRRLCGRHCENTSRPRKNQAGGPVITASSLSLRSKASDAENRCVQFPVLHSPICPLLASICRMRLLINTSPLPANHQFVYGSGPQLSVVL